MQLHCKVINGQVHGPYNLGVSIKGKTLEELIEKGIYPAIINKPDSFEDATEKWLPNEYEILDDVVIVTMSKTNKTQAEKDEVLQKKAQARTEALQDRDAILKTALKFYLAGELTTEQEGLINKAARGKLTMQDVFE